MKSLAEFEALEAARLHVEKQGKLIHRNTMNLILAKNNCYNRLKEIGENPLHPMRDLVSAFIDSTEYNLIQSSETGQGVIELMQTLIAHENNDIDFTNVLNTSISLANKEYKPYENVSEYEWCKARGEAIGTKQVTPINGWLKITITQDVEPHRPQVYAEVQGIMQRVTGFGVVEKAGDYLAQIPRGHSVFYVDDHYRAIA